MTTLADIAMYGWIPVIAILFHGLPPRRAIVAAFLIAWLFLPWARYSIPGLPDFTKLSSTCVGVVLIGLIADPQHRFLRVRPRLYDIPMAVFCATPFATALSNELTPWDGLSAVAGTTITWGIPYWIGRAYFASREGLKELASTIVFGALIYIPFAFFEIAMSPRIHKIVYGWHASPIRTTRRAFGVYRPVVFLQNGLMLGMWMACATLIAFWYWRSRVPSRFGMLTALSLLFTTLACQSFGAIALMTGACLVLFTCESTRTKAALVALVAAIAAYPLLRSTGLWSGESAAGLVSDFFSSGRADSLRFRLDNEVLLVEKALERPMFGWGGYSRSHVFDDKGRDMTISDGLWIVTLGKYGFSGLVSLVGLFLLPCAKFIRKTPVVLWSEPRTAPAAVMMVVVVIYLGDCMFNAMINPLFIIAIGGLSGFVTLRLPPVTRGTSARMTNRSAPSGEADGARTPHAATCTQ